MEIPQSSAALGANQAEIGDFREKLPQNGAGPALMRSRRHFEASRPFVYGIQLAGWSTEKTHGKSSRKCNRTGQSGTAGYQPQSVVVSREEGLLLCSAPALDLMFGSAGGVPVRKLLRPDERHRQPVSRPRAALSVLMLGDSFLELVCVAEIVGAVGATKHVGNERLEHD